MLKPPADPRKNQLKLSWLKSHSAIVGFIEAWGKIVLQLFFDGRFNQRHLESMLSCMTQFKEQSNRVFDQMMAIVESYKDEP